MKKLGFGIMRLPMIGKDVDLERFREMVDLYMGNGFHYFDTAKVYHDGQSETALKDALTSRYPRESFVLTDKLSTWCYEKEEEIRPMFEGQLKACGVEYFDYYLMHAQNRNTYEKYKATRAYEIAAELKAEGKIKHIGISFHDTADVLETILTEHPEIEAVQLQFNYVDYESPTIQSRACYEVARKHGKPVIVMEPVKGGNLANIVPEAAEELKKVGDGSPASFAIRYAAGFDGVMTVLSGMSTLEQLKDNIGYMKDFVPLNDAEHAAIEKVKEILYQKYMIPCTGCRYCVEGCPMNIPIPSLFRVYSNYKAYNNPNMRNEYNQYTAEKGKASSCIECGACEDSCPQHLEIRSLLKTVAEAFEN